jgi:hemerythrin superfamily protein
MDPVKLIKQDHRTVKALFRKFEKATRKAERQKLGEELIEELSVHAAIEEQLLYPALRARDKRSEEPVLNALEEHHAVKMVLAELDKMNADEERYSPKMHVVQESVEMHIEEEERELLPRVQRLFDEDEREQMARAITMMKKAAPNHPHPLAPDTPPGSVFAAMFARLNDTGKDLIRKLTNGDKAEGHRRVVRRAAKASAGAMSTAKRRQASAGRRGATAH